MARVLRKKAFFLGLALAGGALLFAGMRNQERPHGALIEETSRAAGVDAALVRAIIAWESDFDAQRVREGGYGLLQIGKGTGAEWAAAHGVESFMATDLLDARTNLQAGTWYLAKLLEHWRGADDPVSFALAEYVAGPEATHAWAGSTGRAADLRAAMEGTPAEAFVAGVLKQFRPTR